MYIDVAFNAPKVFHLSFRMLKRWTFIFMLPSLGEMLPISKIPRLLESTFTLITGIQTLTPGSGSQPPGPRRLSKGRDAPPSSGARRRLPGPACAIPRAAPEPVEATKVTESLPVWQVDADWKTLPFFGIHVTYGLFDQHEKGRHIFWTEV